MLNRRVVLGSAASLLAGSTFASRALADDADEATLRALAAETGFTGVLMTGRAGRAEQTITLGMHDVEAGLPTRADGVYCLASISKWLTATAVLKLVDQGRLSLEAPITTWLPEYRADTGTKLTLTHLLSNTSGVPALLGDVMRADPSLRTRVIPTEEALRLFCQGDLKFEPGAQFDYAFTNWIIVLGIIERVTGQAFPDGMRTLLLEPLGLNEIGGDDAFIETPRTAVSYRTLEPLVRQPNERMPMMLAAGGYYGTAADLLKAAHGVFDGDLLSTDSQRRLRTVIATGDDYALGGRVRTLMIDGQARPAAWNTGSTVGYRALLAHRFDDGRSLVILNNTSLPNPVRGRLGDAVFGASPPA